MNSKQKSASPIDDLTFDFVSLLHKKAEGLEACGKYLQDAQERNSQPCIDMLNRVIDQDRQLVIELKDHLADMLQNSEQYQSSATQEAPSAPH